MTSQNFKAILTAAGRRALIALPFDPDLVWGARPRHHITGSINGRPVCGPLSLEAGKYVLSLGQSYLRDNDLSVGSEVDVIIAPEGPQAETLAPDIAAALEADPQARQFFMGLATFYRKGYLRWIEGARRPETRQARIAEMVELLKAGRKQR